MSRQTRVLGDRYELQAPLGTGGMGTVWRARDRETGEDCAVKLLAPELVEVEAIATRFEREARVAQAVRDPAVLTVHASGRAADGTPYLVMELLEGESLEQRLQRGALPAGEALTIAVGALRGLEALHAAGVVHRDLKPGNLFLARRGRKLHPKLLDFGVSRAAVGDDGKAITKTGELLGTPAYMAPEQAMQARDVDARADVYGMGAVLYHALSGRPPFVEANLGALVYALMTRDPDPLGVVCPELDPALVAIVHRALAREPGARFASARALREALERVQAEHPELSPGSLALESWLPVVEPGEARGPSLQAWLGVGLVVALGLAAAWWALR